MSTQTEVKHTPTLKLEVIKDKHGREYFAINGKHLALLTERPYQQDAWNEDDFIEAIQHTVRAVNCHEELIKAANTFLESIGHVCEIEDQRTTFIKAIAKAEAL